MSKIYRQLQAPIYSEPVYTTQDAADRSGNIARTSDPTTDPSTTPDSSVSYNPTTIYEPTTPTVTTTAAATAGSSGIDTQYFNAYDPADPRTYKLLPRSVLLIEQQPAAADAGNSSIWRLLAAAAIGAAIVYASRGK